MTSTITRPHAMLRPLTWFLILPLLAACGGSGGKVEFPSGSPPFHTDHELALAEARAQGKPAVLVFSASWCPPCRANKANVYPSAEVRALHGDFVWAYLDTDTAKNRPFAGRYGVNGIPHIQLLDPAGEPLGKVVGGTSPGAFVAELERALERVRVRG